MLRIERETQRLVVTPSGHLPPGLPQDAEELLLRVLSGKLLEVVLQEHEARDVLEHLGLRIVLKALFSDERLDAGDRLLVIANTPEDLTSPLGVETPEVRPPPTVAGTTWWVLSTGYLPAAQMLGTRGKPEWLGGSRLQTLQPRRHSSRVEELLREIASLDANAVRVLPMQSVQALYRFGEPPRPWCGAWRERVSLALGTHGSSASCGRYLEPFAGAKGLLFTGVL